MTAEADADAEAATDASESAGEPVVRVADVGHSFGDLSVLADVSLEVPPGTVACIIGPNGSGKTTLLRHVAGLLEPDHGQVTVAAGDDRSVGYLPQQPAYAGAFTVTETVSFYASLVAADVDIPAVLDHVGLAPVADRRVGALSGGMVRLLGLALTTVGDPPLRILDEPTSGLDPVMSRYIAGIIDEVGAAEDAVLLASHNLAVVERVADVVLVLDRGELVATDDLATLQDRTGAESLEAVLEALTERDESPTVYAGERGGES
jgi:ABC-type multidrug transport system ATPase subunit